MRSFVAFSIKWLIVISLFGGFIYYIKSSEQERDEKDDAEVAPYNDRVSTYLKRKSAGKPRQPARGNIIFIDAHDNQVDKFSEAHVRSTRLPKDPYAVDSVVLHSCEYEVVGTYTSGAQAQQHVCEFTVVDVRTGAWSDWGMFRGSMPAEEIRRRRGGSGPERGSKAFYEFFRAGGIEPSRIQ